MESKNYDLARIIVRIATVQHIDFIDNETNDLSSALADDVHSVEDIKAVSAQVKSTTLAKTIIRDSGATSIAGKLKDEEMLQFSLETYYSFGFEQNDVKQNANSVYHSIEWGNWPEGLQEYINVTGAPFQHAAVQGKLKGKK